MAAKRKSARRYSAKRGRVQRKVGRGGNKRNGGSAQRIVIQIVGAAPGNGAVADPTGETMGLVKAPGPRRARF